MNLYIIKFNDKLEIHNSDTLFDLVFSNYSIIAVIRIKTVFF